ncbi:MAG: nucleotidyltransferase domain-containing protein [Candidatus Woesearchaeota archaeon]
MVNISKLKLTSLQNDILRLLFVNVGNPMNAHNIAQVLKVSQPAISKALPLLEKELLIKIQKDSRSKRLSIELNTDNHQIIWLKRADNIRQIYESGLVQLLYDKLPEATIILFGSYASGEDTVKSDIDLAVIGARHKNLDIKRFGQALGREIIINNYESFEKIDKHLKNSLINGILLKGAIEL